MVRFLVDTMYVIWAATAPEYPALWAQGLLSSTENEVLVSAASVYEIAYKVQRGKLPEATLFERNLLANISKLGYTVLPLSPEIMHRAARFTAAHADPFDRIIAAHAIHLDIDVLSTDPALDAFGVRRMTPPN